MPRRIVVLDPTALPNADGVLAELGRCFERGCGDGSCLTVVADRAALLEALPHEDLVVVDRKLGDGVEGGEHVLAAIRAANAEIPVVMVAEHGDVETAARAIEAGANDFLVRGDRLADRVATLVVKIRTVVGLTDARRRLATENASLRDARVAFVGESDAIRKVAEMVKRVAMVPRPVLIVGERGTGKELVARGIHEAATPTGPFVAVNCAALADSLLDSELFGHERGAFTGATERRRGKLELAAGGTLFLDEVGNMSLSFQQKMLRAIEYRTFVRVGGDGEAKFEARVVAATNVDLMDAIARGTFLPDLYDRLAFEVIEVPPLRERRSDIPLLAHHLFARFTREVPSFHGKRLGEDALELLCEYDFPGNVRELKNIIERAVYRDTKSTVSAEDIGILRGRSAVKDSSFEQKVAAYERKLVGDALHAAHNNQANAARALGLEYHQLRYYKKKYGL